MYSMLFRASISESLSAVRRRVRGDELSEEMTAMATDVLFRYNNP